MRLRSKSAPGPVVASAGLHTISGTLLQIARRKPAVARSCQSRLSCAVAKPVRAHWRSEAPCRTRFAAAATISTNRAVASRSMQLVGVASRTGVPRIGVCRRCRARSSPVGGVGAERPGIVANSRRNVTFRHGECGVGREAGGIRRPRDQWARHDIVAGGGAKCARHARRSGHRARQLRQAPRRRQRPASVPCTP